jgi:hypothetical protein
MMASARILPKNSGQNERYLLGSPAITAGASTCALDHPSLPAGTSKIRIERNSKGNQGFRPRFDKDRTRPSLIRQERDRP